MPTVITDHFSNIQSDPLRNFKFLVTFSPLPQVPGHPSVNFDNAGPNQGAIGFMSVSGINAANEIIPYREGGNNTSTRKLPGQTNFSDITLTRGVVYGNNPMWRWFQRIFFVTQGAGPPAINSNFRAANMDIYVMGHPDTTESTIRGAKAHFKVYNVWPSSVAFSDLDAGGNAILVNQMVLTNEGWDMSVAANNTSTAPEPADASTLI